MLILFFVMHMCYLIVCDLNGLLEPKKRYFGCDPFFHYTFAILHRMSEAIVKFGNEWSRSSGHFGVRYLRS